MPTTNYRFLMKILALIMSENNFIEKKKSEINIILQWAVYYAKSKCLESELCNTLTEVN